MAVSAEQKKQFLNTWLEKNGVQHDLTENSSVDEFSKLAKANEWDGKYEIAQEAPIIDGEDFDETPKFKMEYSRKTPPLRLTDKNGVTRLAPAFVYRLEDKEQAEEFKAWKKRDEKSRGYTSPNPLEHWVFDTYRGKTITVEGVAKIDRLVEMSELTALDEMYHDLGVNEQILAGLSDNAMKLLVAKVGALAKA